MPRLFSHIDVRVRDLERSARFYDAVLAVLGFRRQTYPLFAQNEAGWRADGWSPNDEFFGIVADVAMVPNVNRFALCCNSPEQVALVADAARQHGGRDVDGPAVSKATPRKTVRRDHGDALGCTKGGYPADNTATIDGGVRTTTSPERRVRCSP